MENNTAVKVELHKNESRKLLSKKKPYPMTLMRHSRKSKTKPR